jgi:hypothetical protein
MAVCMSTVTLQKCLILDCYATEKAGAIFVDDIDSRLVVTGTVIRDCRAPRAGALEVQNGVVDIVESVFDNCRADSVPGSQIDADERGVAIVIKNQGNVKSSIFTIVPACSFSASASLIHWVASHQHPLNLRGLQVVEPLACDTPVVVNSSSQISNHALGTCTACASHSSCDMCGISASCADVAITGATSTIKCTCTRDNVPFPEACSADASPFTMGCMTPRVLDKVQVDGVAAQSVVVNLVKGSPTAASASRTLVVSVVGSE